MEQFAISVAEFCAGWGISKPMYYRLRREGRGPRIVRVGRRTLITPEANAEWGREMEEQQDASAPEGAT